MKAKIISNSCVKGPCYKLLFKPLALVKSAPGQFLMIRPGASDGPSDPLLPRPFSIHRATADGNIEVLYKREGDCYSGLPQCGRGIRDTRSPWQWVCY